MIKQSTHSESESITVDGCSCSVGAKGINKRCADCMSTGNIHQQSNINTIVLIGKRHNNTTASLLYTTHIYSDWALSYTHMHIRTNKIKFRTFVTLKQKLFKMRSGNCELVLYFFSSFSMLFLFFSVFFFLSLSLSLLKRWYTCIQRIK